MALICTFIVDDNPEFSDALTRLVRDWSNGVCVVGTATGALEALERVASLKPDVLLLDLRLPDLPGLKAIPRFRELLPEMAIIAVSMMDPDLYGEAARRAGAADFVAKSQVMTDLLPAIRRAAKRDT